MKLIKKIIEKNLNNAKEEMEKEGSKFRFADADDSKKVKKTGNSTNE